MTERGEVLAWLRAHVAYEGTECLTWPYAKDGCGYGKLVFEGRLKGAHRVMAMLKLGPAPFPKAEAAHTCNNGTGGCVNPNHLKWATRRENELDKVRAGFNTGETHPRAKLTNEKVREMRAMFASATVRAVARMYGIDASQASRIKNGQVWRAA